MANKLVTVFLVCIAVVAAMYIHKAEAHLADTEDLKARYKDCFSTCLGDCESNKPGYTFCEMKCDADCLAKEAAAKFGVNPGN